jgi:anti-sigma-K factor RskA
MMSDLHTLSGAYALDALSGDEAREFEGHMGDCASCSIEVLELREAAASMGASQALTPPPALKARVLAAAERQPQLPPLVTHLDDAGKKRRRRRIAIGAAAAVLAAVAGVTVTQTQGGPELSRPVAAVFHAPDVHSTQVRTSNGGTITVATSQQLDEMAVDTHQLPALSKAKVYQLWSIVAGHPSSAGLLTDVAAGRAMPLPPHGAAVAITIEPAGGSRQPTSQPIVVLSPTRV